MTKALNIEKVLLIIFFNVLAASCTRLRPCDAQHKRYRLFRRQHPNFFVSTRTFLRTCDDQGWYRALQSDEYFLFCVSTKTGQEIPDTRLFQGSIYSPGRARRFINEYVCTLYSNLWIRFLTFYKTILKTRRNNKICRRVERPPCPGELVYRRCGCNRVCIPGRDMSKFKEDCSKCSPICTCPKGLYKYCDKCISAHQCLRENPNRLWKEMQMKWKKYFDSHASPFLKQSNKPIPPEEEYYPEEEPIPPEEEPIPPEEEPVPPEEEDPFNEEPHNEQTTTVDPFFEEIDPNWIE